MQDDVELDLELGELMDTRSGSPVRTPQIQEQETKRTAASLMGLGGLPSDVGGGGGGGYMRASFSVSPPIANVPSVAKQSDEDIDSELASEMQWTEPKPQAMQTSEAGSGAEGKSGKDEKQSADAGAIQESTIDWSKAPIVEGTKKQAKQQAFEAWQEYLKDELKWSTSRRTEKAAQVAERPKLVLPKSGRSKDSKAMMDDDYSGNKAQRPHMRSPPTSTHIDSLSDRYLSMLGRAQQQRIEENGRRALAAAAEMQARVNGNDDMDSLDSALAFSELFNPPKIQGQKVARVQ